MLATAGVITKARADSAGYRRAAGALLMVICGVVCVVDASGIISKILAGVLMGCAETGIVIARRNPSPRLNIAAVVLTMVCGLVVTVLVPQGLGEAPVLVGAAVLPRFLPAGRVRYAAIVIVAIVFGASIMVISGSPVGLIAGAGAWALGDSAIEHVAFEAERDRALALLAEVETSRQAVQEAAAAEERNRIAREMHDVLAHSLAGLSMQLQAVRAVAGREGAPASVTGPIDRAAELAREGVQEARAAVGALRAPRMRGVDDLKQLVEEFPGQARLAVTGQPGRVSQEAGHAVYRAVQEAMTNTARYATGSDIDVEVTWEAADLRVLVRDYGLPADRQPSGVQGSGTGIASMASRVEAVAGTLAAGPDPHGPGWRVELRVPVITSGADGVGADSRVGA